MCGVGCHWRVSPPLPRPSKACKCKCGCVCVKGGWGGVGGALTFRGAAGGKTRRRVSLTAACVCMCPVHTGLAQMIAAMRPDIDNIDEYVRNTTARAFR